MALDRLYPQTSSLCCSSGDCLGLLHFANIQALLGTPLALRLTEKSPLLSQLPRKLYNAAVYLRNHGARRFGRELQRRLVDYYFERRLGIHTANTVRLAEIGINRADARDSMPVGYAAFYSVLKSIPIEPSNSVFLDYGVGKGRAVCAAATFPFSRIIGVDISEVLIDIAQANLRRMRHRKTHQVMLTHGDAIKFEIPGDVNLVHFFNPFAGDTLRKVVDNMYCSYQMFPRKMYIMFFNNDHFDKIVGNQPWVSKMYQTGFHPDISCGVYETRPDHLVPACDTEFQQRK